MSSTDKDYDDIERTICQLPSVHVFRIPTLKNAAGHRAADWPKDPSWSGKLKIVSKGKKAAIFLLEQDNRIFATCPVEEGAVERVTDSGRYFVLKIVNDKGRHAFIGIAFNERNDAFDFNVALQEHKNELEREEQAAAGLEATSGQLKDLSLKEGEKIKVKVGGWAKKKHDDSAASHGNQATDALPPPRVQRPSNQSQTPSSISTNSDVIQHFDVFSSSNTSTTNSNSSVFSFDANFGSDPFGDSFSSNSSTTVNDFSSSDPFSSVPAVATTNANNSKPVASNLLDFDF